MKTDNLRGWLTSTFTKSELDCVPATLLGQNITLKEVEDLQVFLRNCDEESASFKVAGEHRKNDWEKGWERDGVYFSSDLDLNNIPFYFKKNKFIRLNGKVYEDKSGFSELYLLRALQHVVFRKASSLLNFSSVVEYGCGTGSNIEQLKKYYSLFKYYGADWAESACRNLVSNKILAEDCVYNVNFFDPSSFKAPKELFLAFTNASLEQSGARFTDFMNYLMNNEFCGGGMHIEPIRELLDLNSELNQQSYRYQERRSYLSGFIEYLKKQNITIHLEKDFGIGSHYMSGYQVVIWTK